MSFVDRLRESPSRPIVRRLRDLATHCSLAILGRARLRQAATKIARKGGNELSASASLLKVIEAGLSPKARACRGTSRHLPTFGVTLDGTTA